MESASAVSDAPSDASPSVLRASKKLCVRGGCLSLINAAGGAGSALVGERLVLGMAFDGAGSADEGFATKSSAAVAVAGAIFAFEALVVAALGASGGAVEADRSDFDDAGAFTATVAPGSEAAGEAAIGAGAVESDVEGVAGVAAEASVGEAGLGDAERGPRSSEANADSPKNANNIAHAMASLTQSPLHVSARRLSRKPGSND